MSEKRNWPIVLLEIEEKIFPKTPLVAEFTKQFFPEGSYELLQSRINKRAGNLHDLQVQYKYRFNIALMEVFRTKRHKPI